MVMVLINGLTTENTLEIGSIIKCTELVSSHGLMVENMMVSTMMTRNRDTVYSLGQIIDNTMATG